MYRISFVAAAILAAAGPSSAQPARPLSAAPPTILTLADTLARAKERAGVVAVARARVAEAEASLLDASMRVRANPELAIQAGPRSSSAGRTVDLELGVAQQLETGGQRAARIDGARAGVARVQLEVAVAERQSMLAAADAFLDGIAAAERVRIADDADGVAREFLEATERRYAVGDVPAMDVNLARIEAARTAAARRDAGADLAAALGRLRAVLRLPADTPLSLDGTLDVAPLPALDSLHALAAQRPELAALDAEAQEAAAQTQLGRSMRRPDISLRAALQREQTDTVVLGGFSVSLPTVQRGQATFAAGIARASRVRIEHEVESARILADVDAAYAEHQQRVALAAAFAADAIPGVADNDDLGRRSYEAGELGLLQYLLIRRDAIDARRALVDYRLEAARSRILLDYLAGALR